MPGLYAHRFVRFKISLKLRVDTLRVATVKPLMQFFHLLGRESVYCAFNILHRS
ncbi:MAG TPA: hypothetical protein VKB79_13435 [Bryobacteraceae bacterium]|nr:hypothetical protein [Bryobacteraceae bacterium]